MLFGDLIDRALAAGAGPRPALIDAGGQLSYADLDRAANRFAQTLGARGFGPGSRIAIQASNRLVYVIILLGAARAGVVLVHLATRSTPAERSAALAMTGTGMLFTDETLADPTWFDRGPDDRPPLDLPPDAPLALLFSGGTTGTAKGVLVGHRARLVTAEIVAAAFGLSDRDRVLVSTPLFHTAGLFCWLAPALSRGATVILAGKWSAEAFTAQVEAHRVTAAFLVPTQVGDLLAAPEPERLGSLRLICHAGAPIRPDLADRLAALLPAIEISEHYGLSETGLLTVRLAGDPPDRRTSVGRAPVPIELAVRDADGTFLPPGTVGEIVTHGPHLLSGLIGDDRRSTPFPWGDGWFATGDRGCLDADGFLTLVARSKDIIVSGAENLYPSEIEAVLGRHPALAECAVFGVPDERLGEVPIAQVVLHPGMEASEAELIDLVLSALPRYKRPRRVIFAPSLPRSAIGKVLKSVLSAEYLARR
jgi:fatty-acyl-CoA synthase